MEPRVVEELAGATVTEGRGGRGARVVTGCRCFGVEGGAPVAEGLAVVVVFLAVGTHAGPDDGNDDDGDEAANAGRSDAEDESEVGDAGETWGHGGGRGGD